MPRQSPEAPPHGTPAGIDFFDVDHTLTRRSSGGRFVAAAMRQSLFPQRLLILMPWYSLTYRLGIFRPQAYEHGFPFLRGLARSTLEQVARESFERTPERGPLRAGRGAGERAARRGTARDARHLFPGHHRGAASGVPRRGWRARHGAGVRRTGRARGACRGMPMFRREKSQRVLSFLDGQGVARGGVLLLLRQHLRPAAPGSRGKPRGGQSRFPPAPDCEAPPLEHIADEKMRSPAWRCAQLPLRDGLAPAVGQLQDEPANVVHVHQHAFHRCAGPQEVHAHDLARGGTGVSAAPLATSPARRKPSAGARIARRTSGGSIRRPQAWRSEHARRPARRETSPACS